MNGDHPYPYERWDMRKAQRHMAAQEIDPRDKEALAKLFGKRKPTIAEMIAIKRLSKAMSGDNGCMDAVENNVCGKLPDTIFMPNQEKVEKIVIERVSAPKHATETPAIGQD